MSQGQDDTMQGLGCGRGCAGYQWVQGVDGLGNTVGYWQPTEPLAPGAPYARNGAPFFGEIAEAADGNLYQWVQGVDGLGSPFGFWKRIKRLARRALPFVQRIAPFVPGGAAALTAATPFLKQAGIAGLGDVGALYAAPDGSLYQVQGVDAADSIDGFAEDDLNGLDDDELRGLADDDLNGMGDDELRGLSDDELRGLAADDELSGYGEGEDLNGFGADPDLSGFAAMDPLDGMDADELTGYSAGDDLDGFADDELNGFADDELRGIGDDERMSGYVRDGRITGIEGYRPDGPPTTPAFSPAANAPMWAPLW
jgi:hypothetical protein